MPVTYGFYDSLNGDRTYNANQLSSMLDGVITDGIFSTIGLNLVVRNGTGMNVIVGSGRAWFNRTWTDNDTDLILAVDASDVVLNRIDNVVLEVNSAVDTRANSIKIVKGSPASTPSAPALVHTEFIHQYKLAEILISAGVTEITADKLTNKVGLSETPFAAGAIDTVNIDNLLAQWDAEFQLWFTNLQNQLTENQVTNLQNQIDGLESQENGWLPSSDSWAYSSVDGPTGIVSIAANMMAKLAKGMRVKYTQVHTLTAYWNLDSNSNSQIGSFNGTDTAITYAAGKFNNAAGFNGTSSKIVIADAAALKPTTNFTIGAWIKTSVTGTVKYIYQSFSSNSNLAGIALYIGSDEKIYFITGNNTGTVAGTNYSSINSKTSVTDNAWHYVVGVFRNNYAQLYIDGKLENSGYMLTPAYAATNYVRIGCNCGNGSDGLWYSGQIDDVFYSNNYGLDEKLIYDKYIQGTAQGTGNISVTKVGIITDVGAYSGGNTLITVYHGNDFNLVNSTITNPYFSHQKDPYGFNVNPDKWSVLYKDSSGGSQATPAANTWYNVATKSAVIPLGCWDLSYKILTEAQYSAATSVKISMSTTLSNVNNAESDPDMSYIMSFDAIANVSAYLGSTASARKIVSLSSKTTYYINESVDVATVAGIHIFGIAIIKAVCAYL